MAAGEHLGQLAVVRLLQIEPIDLGAGRHDRPHGTVGEMEHPLHHLVFRLLEHAGFSPLADQSADLLLGEIRFALDRDAEQPQQGIGGASEQMHQRRSPARQPAHRPGDSTGDRFRVVEGDALGHQLPDHQRQIGDGADHQSKAEGLTPGTQGRDRVEQRLETA